MTPDIATSTLAIEPAAPPRDRSMLVLQYGTALAAVLGAFLLASIR
jgi:hypothetical protein